MSDLSQEPERGRYAIWQALPLLLFTICAVGLIAVLAWRSLAGVQGTAAVLDAAVAVCGGQGVASAAAYQPNTPTTNPVVAFRQLADGRLLTDSTAVLPAWLPTQPDQLALVLCLGQERPAYRTICTAAGEPSTILAEYGREIPATLREARTAAILAESVIASVDDAPTGCLREIPNPTPPDVAVSPAQVQAWLRPWVAGGGADN
ncbi:MAG: hypothetical protein IPL28_13775 [Chloroflexi bacterium]|nr:hypothetical protein [Chloroflexota bacterium]